MKWVIFSFIFVFIACDFHTSDQKKTSSSIFVLYESWTSKVKVENGKLFYSITEYEYDNPTSATPSSSTVKIVFEDIDLSEKILNELVEKIESSGFFDLEKDAYGADEMQRFYPYTIKIHIGKKMKEVKYRSNPTSEPTPVAFTILEEYLTTELTTKK